jgi:hypothetical protein
VASRARNGNAAPIICTLFSTAFAALYFFALSEGCPFIKILRLYFDLNLLKALGFQCPQRAISLRRYFARRRAGTPKTPASITHLAGAGNAMRLLV